MSKQPVKYNPAFLSEEQLSAAFVVRHDDRDMVLNVIRENNGTSNQHVLVIGPRGIGKTMLMHRVALDVRQDEELSRQWYPLIFAEESYEVSSAGEFWLESIFHLANQTGDIKWTQTYEELRKEQDEDRLGRRAVAQLMDFADSQNKRILLVVENLNMILGDQLSDDCAWKLRHTLMHEPRVMLLATATANLDLPENINKAFFELFKTHYLKPLDDADCQIVWKAIAGNELGPRRIRALSILTGGNPRLLTIISHFGAQLSFSDLMQDLTALVDDHTDYFKSHLESLPPVERKVYVALADLWDPVMARDVAAAARLGVSKTSSLLKRLVSRGVVTEQPGKGRTKLYRVTERMYNVYYLMRRRGAPSERVRAAVHFMVQFYEEKEILEITKRLGEEACKLSCEERRCHFFAYEGIMKAASPELRLEILKCTPASFLTATDRPDSLGALLGQIVSTGDPSTDLNKCLNGLQDALDRENEKEAVVAIRSAKAMLIDPVIKTLFEGLEYEIVGQYVDAELIYKKILKEYPGNTAAWGKLGLLLQRFEDRAEEAKDAYQKVIELDPADWWAWWMLGRLNHKQLNNYEAAEEAYRKALSGNEKLETAWAQLGQLLHETNRPAEAEVAYKKAITLDPKYKWAWAQYGELLHDKLERYEEAKNAYDKVIALDPEYSWAWAQLGSLFHEKIADYGQAETAYRKALDIDSEYGWAWGQLGHLLHEHTTRYDEAEAAYDKAIQLCSDNPYPRILRAMLLFEHTERHVEAITSIYEFIEDPEALYMFARLFIELGYYTETLPILSKTLAHPEFVGSKIDDMTTLFAELAAGGQAKAAIPILRDSKCAVILEPILVALRMSVGEEVAVAPEIEQIAKDVLKEFEAMKEKRANSKKPELLH